MAVATRRQLPAVFPGLPAGSDDGSTYAERRRQTEFGLYQAIRASLDAAATTSENAKHWADTDSLSARAAFSPLVRKTVRERSRLEAENNSWYAGILRTASNHIVGRGPRLQFLSTDPAANRRIEKAFRKWWVDQRMTENLRVAVQTYWRDGEVFFMRRYRPNTRGVGTEILVYEADQVTSPHASPLDSNVDDGVRLDQFERPIAYYVLNHHPGDMNAGHRDPLAGDWYPACDVLHLFRKERPGQMRGIPRVTPSLELFPKLRRHTSATLLAAEAVANWTLFVKTNSAAITPSQMPEDFVSLDFARNMMTFLPDGWDPFQMKAEQPTTNHEMFQRQTLMEICRCFCMPLLLACGTSKDSNFSSAQMDIRNIWEPEVKSEQECFETVVLDEVLKWFFEDAVYVAGLLDGLPPLDEVEHLWFWDPLPTTDELTAAQAASERLKTGQSTHEMEYARRGLDAETQMQRGANLLDVPIERFREAVFTAIFAAAPALGAPAPNYIPAPEIAL